MHDYDKMDTESLHVARKEMQKVNNQISSENPEVQWSRWKKLCSKLIEDNVPARKQTKSKPWVTTEILDMMEKRHVLSEVSFIRSSIKKSFFFRCFISRFSQELSPFYFAS